MDFNPKISVIIPLYNHEKYIKEAVYSVLEQTIADFELIIINDGSSDNSEDVVKSIKDDRIKYLYQENQGAHNTINRGIQLAQGEYVSILNSDDVYYKSRFEEALKILESDSSIHAVFSHLEFIDEKGDFLRYFRGAEDFWKDRSPGILYKKTNNIVLDLFAGNFLITTSNLFIRKGVFTDIGYFKNLRYTHDYDFFLRCCSHFKTNVINAPLLKYRQHGTNTIKENEAATYFETGLIFTDFFLTHDFNNVFGDELHRYEALVKLSNYGTPGNSERMIMFLLYLMRYKDTWNDVFKELIENIENPFRKACIDSFNNNIDLWQNAREAWRSWAETNDRLIEANAKLSEADMRLGELLHSYSYRVGMALTWPVRKVLWKQKYTKTKRTKLQNIIARIHNSVIRNS